MFCLSKNGAKIANSLPNFPNFGKKVEKSSEIEESLSFWAGFLAVVRLISDDLVLNDCFVRASADAGSAANASVSVDDIDVAFRDSAHRAFVNA